MSERRPVGDSPGPGGLPARTRIVAIVPALVFVRPAAAVVRIPQPPVVLAVPLAVRPVRVVPGPAVAVRVTVVVPLGDALHGLVDAAPAIALTDEEAVVGEGRRSGRRADGSDERERRG